jgi:hypothetical protein
MAEDVNCSTSAVEVWESNLQGKKYHGAYGPRDVLIIRSSEEGPDIVPRKESTLTADDKDMLTNQGVPKDCWEDDVQIMEARYKKEGRFNVLPVECECITKCQNVLGKVKALMNNTDKPGGK